MTAASRKATRRSGCLATGEERNECFARALEAHAPFAQQAHDAETCREALASRAGVDTDACDALEALNDPRLIGGLLECASDACEEMASCFLQVLLARTPQPLEGCG